MCQTSRLSLAPFQQRINCLQRDLNSMREFPLLTKKFSWKGKNLIHNASHNNLELFALSLPKPLSNSSTQQLFKTSAWEKKARSPALRTHCKKGSKKAVDALLPVRSQVLFVNQFSNDLHLIITVWCLCSKLASSWAFPSTWRRWGFDYDLPFRSHIACICEELEILRRFGFHWLI